jgi:hypothetical protein
LKLRLDFFVPIIIFGLLTGCSSDVRIENPGATSNADSGEGTSQSSDEPIEEINAEESRGGSLSGGIGDALEGTASRITLNSVSFAKPNQFLEPTYGLFIVANITIENLSEEALSISSLGSFELQGSDLYIYSQALGLETRGSLDSTIPSGGSLRGEIAFDVPELDSFELRYKENLFGEVQSTFSFKFSEINQ